MLLREGGAEFIPTGLLLGHPLPHPGLGIQVCNEETPALLLAPGPEPLTSPFSSTPRRAEADSIPAREKKDIERQ